MKTARLSLQEFIKLDLDQANQLLWSANHEITGLLGRHDDLEALRKSLFDYLAKSELWVLQADNKLHDLEKSVVRQCIRVLRNIIAPINESRTDYSALRTLWALARGVTTPAQAGISAGFIAEFFYLFRGVRGELDIYKTPLGEDSDGAEFLEYHGSEAATKRSDELDRIAREMNRYFANYPSGLEPDVIERRNDNKDRILRYFASAQQDWEDYQWHLKHIIRDAKTLADLIELDEVQIKAVEKCRKYRIPFGITPYYLSLMEPKKDMRIDAAVRAQVIPPPDYVKQMAANIKQREAMFDFMGEHDTSPIDLITRRYPKVCIIKPYNTCSQICVYCQRNWEIDDVFIPSAMASKEKLKAALDWLEQHPMLGDILITGGDPFIMLDKVIEPIIDRLASFDHVYRIRIGTRTPVVLPQRITDSLCEILDRALEPGKREVGIVTHFEHPYEVTPQAMEAVRKLRKLGIGVYNQQVFTYYNSRKFETVKLRMDLRKIGVEPYYTFNMKGKSETRAYMTPIARLLQERKEEARLIAGMGRTDEPVFNVPRLGKNHLRAWQDHNVLMILPDGSRVYEFHPWEKNIQKMPTYIHTDVPIYEYLLRLSKDGEDVNNYKNIWYYY